MWFVELKSTGRKPSKIQEVVIGWLRDMGFQVFIIDRQEQLDEFFTIVDLTA